MSPKGVERWRLEGFHDRSEFEVWLRMGLARVAFMAKAWDEARRWYEEIERQRRTSRYHAQAMYWRAVCEYNASHDAAPLLKIADDLHAEHPESLWALRTNAWLPEDHPANRASLR